jgi:hypothetical protein
MINKKQLIEESDAIFRFIYGKNFFAWYEFCADERTDKGNQSIQSTSMLVRSLTQPQPWRFVISAQELNMLTFKMAESLNNVADKLVAEVGTQAFLNRLALIKELSQYLEKFGKEIREREEHEA